MRVVAIGDNCLDVYVEQGVLTVGGNALNVAAGWRAMGLDSRYLGVVGDDPAAAIVRSAIGELGLSEADLGALPGPTGVTLVRLIDQDRTFLYEEFGVGMHWRPDAAEMLVAGADWYHTVGTAPEAGVREALLAAGRRVSVDLSTHALDTLGAGALDGVEVAFASADGPEEEAQGIAAALCDAGARVGVVMRGADGSLARERGSSASAQAERIVPVDTCGAGDSFIAGFTAARLSGGALDAALGAGTAAATRTCLHLGGFPQRAVPIPDWLRTDYFPRAGL